MFHILSTVRKHYCGNGPFLVKWDFFFLLCVYVHIYMPETVFVLMKEPGTLITNQMSTENLVTSWKACIVNLLRIFFKSNQVSNESLSSSRVS